LSEEFTNEFRDTVRERTDIVQLIGESVPLISQRGGREYKALCPFHDDHNPSMTVNPERQSYRCWSCNAGGDVFTFVMEREKVGFRDALEILARRANIPMPERTQRAHSSGPDKPAIYEALLWAEGLFHQTFLKDPSAAKARDYVRSRGLTDETVSQWRIGYHPNNWDWLQHQARGKFAPPVFVAARLIGERDGGRGYYDNFVDRILFPIHNERGQAVAFGGRVYPGGVDTDKGKYWNSPESEVFPKRRTLYGFDHARDAIRDSNTSLVVEGYTDCIACHQAGVKNVVATLGTALTEDHVKTLKRFAQKVVLLYDGDEAGQSNSERVIERLLAEDVDLRVLSLPGELDPDEFLREQGADALRPLIENAPEAWEFKLRVVERRYDSRTVDGRQRILDEMLSLLSSAPKMSRHIREALLLSSLAHRLNLPDGAVRERYNEIRSKKNLERRAPTENVRSVPISESVQQLMRGRLSYEDKLECELLEVLMVSPELVQFVTDTLEPSDFRHPAIRELLEQLVKVSTDHQGVTHESFRTTLDDGDLKSLAVWLDEQARVKDVGKKLRESGVDESDRCPRYLRSALDSFVWRQDEQQFKTRTALPSSSPRDGTPTPDDVLRQAQQFHQRRANKKTGV
jgi:DNA primase